MAADGLLAPLAEEEYDSDLVSDTLCSAALNLHVVVHYHYTWISSFQNGRNQHPIDRMWGRTMTCLLLV